MTLCPLTIPQPLAPTSPSEVAAALERARPGWVIIWSQWRRCFSAFAACSPTPLVIDEPTVGVLSDRMNAAEMAIRAGRRVDP